MSRRRFVPQRGELTRRARRWLDRHKANAKPLQVVQHHPDGTHSDHIRYLAPRLVVGPDNYQRVIGPGLEHQGPNRQQRREHRPGKGRRPSLAAASRVADGRQPLRRREAEAVAEKRRLARHGITGPVADLMAAQHVRTHP